MIPWGENNRNIRCGEVPAAHPSSTGTKGAAATETPRALSSFRREVAPLPRASVRRGFMPGYWRHGADQVIRIEFFHLQTFPVELRHKNARSAQSPGNRGGPPMSLNPPRVTGFALV